MKELPNECIDLIIADPPYNIGKDKGAGWDIINDYLNIFEQWVKEWKKVLSKDGLLYCYCSQIFQADIEIILRKYFIVQNRIIWNYNNGQRQATKRFSYSYEPIFMVSNNNNNNFTPVRDSNNIQKGIRKKHNKNGTITITEPNPNGIKFTDVWNIPKLSGNRKQTKHPTEKPTELSNRMIKSLKDINLIYIPFAGSGSEIISCINNNRNYIATEINNTYIEDIIIPRIKKEINDRL